jgi:hypothetical protein
MYLVNIVHQLMVNEGKKEGEVKAMTTIVMEVGGMN